MSNNYDEDLYISTKNIICNKEEIMSQKDIINLYKSLLWNFVLRDDGDYDHEMTDYEIMEDAREKGMILLDKYNKNIDKKK